MSAVDRYPLLLSPFELRGRRLRNRIVSTPHATGWSRDGLIDRSEVAYHVRKAAGGCGLVMTTKDRADEKDAPLIEEDEAEPATPHAGVALVLGERHARREDLTLVAADEA